MPVVCGGRCMEECQERDKILLAAKEGSQCAVISVHGDLRDIMSAGGDDIHVGVRCFGDY